MILFRYLSRELILTLLAITGILLAIFLCNQFVMFLSKTVVGKLPGDILGYLLLLQTPYLLSVLLPLGLYLSILLVFGRLYVDNEMTVMSACGVSIKDQIKMTMVLATLVAVIVAIMNIWLNPKIMAYEERLTSDSSTSLALKTILPGRFKATKDGKQVFYVEGMSRSHKHMKHLFIAQIEHPMDPEAKSWQVLVARKGKVRADKKSDDNFIIVNDGYRYVGTPGKNNFQITKFDEYGQRVVGKRLVTRNKPETLPLAALVYKAIRHDKSAIAELQWRFSLPLGVFVLTLLAVPLSRVTPRQGRYAQLLPAVLIYLVYSNLFIVNKRWIEKGVISSELGMWWLHGIVIAIALLLWVKQIGWRAAWQYFFPRSKKVRAS